MSEQNLEACLAFVFVQEGGFVDDPMDPGGATNLGITLDELSRWRHTAVSKQDVRDLQKSEATAIYTANYWNVIQGAGLPGGVDLTVLDAAVNLGTSRAARMLQTVVGAGVDGHIGPLTLTATRQRPAAEVIDAFNAARVAFYRGLATFDHFGRGWLARVDRVKAEALRLAGQA